MHPYIEFSHVVFFVALPEQHSVKWVLDDVLFVVKVSHVDVPQQTPFSWVSDNEHMHNLLKLFISVFVELVQVCLNLLWHIRCLDLCLFLR
jgi:hypothetical protein